MTKYTGFYFSDNMGGFYYQSLTKQQAPVKFFSRAETIEELAREFGGDLINGVLFYASTPTA